MEKEKIWSELKGFFKRTARAAFNSNSDVRFFFLAPLSTHEVKKSVFALTKSLLYLSKLLNRSKLSLVFV